MVRMKNYILHGENHADSRDFLLSVVEQAKAKGLDIVYVNGQTALVSELLTAARSQSLITLGQLLVIENFITLNKKAGDTLLKILETKDENTFVVFWEKKTIAPSLASSLGKSILVRHFKIPNSIFKFLDTLSPNNQEQALKLLQNTKKSTSAEFLLAMIARQLRLLIWTKMEPATLTAAAWQKKKLTEQAKKFDEKQLLDLHKKLLEIDRLEKRSELPENLYSSLELLVASI